jgi:hypothetical protein
MGTLQRKYDSCVNMQLMCQRHETFIDKTANLCYNLGMDDDRHIWEYWAKPLYRWRIQEWVASLLEITGVLNILTAQMIYLLQPLFIGTMVYGRLNTLGMLLEDEDQTRAFIRILRCDGDHISNDEVMI